MNINVTFQTSKLILPLFVFITISCVSTSDQTSISDSIDDIKHKYPSRIFLSAQGAGSSLKRAATEAKASLIEQISSNIEVQTKSKRTLVTGSGSREAMSVTAKISSSFEYGGLIKIASSSRSRDGSVFEALAVLNKKDFITALGKDLSLTEKEILSKCQGLNIDSQKTINIFQCQKYGKIRELGQQLDSMILKHLGVFGREPKVSKEVANCSGKIASRLEVNPLNLVVYRNSIQPTEKSLTFLSKIFSSRGVRVSDAKVDSSQVSFISEGCSPVCRKTELGHRCSCGISLTLKSKSSNVSRTFKIGPLLSISNSQAEAKQRMFQRINKKATVEIREFLDQVKNGCNI